MALQSDADEILAKFVESPVSGLALIKSFLNQDCRLNSSASVVQLDFFPRLQSRGFSALMNPSVCLLSIHVSLAASRASGEPWMSSFSVTVW